MRFEIAAVLMLAVGCAVQTQPSADRAAAGYLEVHNHHDHEVARALWGKRADDVERSIEWFRNQVGSCDSFTPMRITNDLDARYVFSCERGELEVALRVDAETGAVRRTLFGARGVEPPLEVCHAVEQLVAVANGDPADLPTLAKRLEQTEVEAGLVAIAQHGQCRIDRVHLGSAAGGRFVLECKDGSATVTLDLNRKGEVRRFFVDDGAKDTWRRTG